MGKSEAGLISIATRGGALRKFILHLAIVLLVLRSIQGDVFFLLSGSILGCTLFLIGVLKGEKTTTPSFVALLVFLVSYSFTFLNNYFSDGILFLPLVFGAYGIAWELYKNNLNVGFSIFLFYASATMYLLLYFAFGYSEGEILDHSRNHVSVYFINLISLLFIALNAENIESRKMYIIPALITSVISVIAIGVSGILSSSILLLIVLLVFLRRVGPGIVISVFFGVALFSGLSIYYVELTNFVTFDRELLQKLSVSKFSSDPRYEIWGEYISSLDWLRILSGVPLSETFYGFQNLHSSYFLLHERIGLLSFIIFFVFLVSLLKVYKVSKLLFACLLSILIRGLSDTTFLSASPFDFVLFYLVLFYPYRDKFSFVAKKKHG